MFEKELFNLFRGLRRAYGMYKIEGKSAKGKVEGKAVTIQELLTEEHWAKHLAGEKGIGIVPITDRNTCAFAAIDIDVYNLDLKKLEANIRKLQLPLVVCRTKSGGAHLYLFLTEEVSAKIIRKYMTQWAIALGYPGVEIFPKQDTLAGPEDVGNWINMPYFDAERTMRYAVHNGLALQLDEFVAYAQSMVVSEEDLTFVEFAGTDELLKGAPPCLVTLALNGVPEGSRNNALYNFAVLARQQRDGQDWQDLLGEFNNEYLNPPLPLSEVNALVKSLGKKDYFYKCKDAPINNVCNKELCRTCDYGIGGSSQDPGVTIGELTKILTDPPVWIIQVDSARLELETDDLLMQRRFAKKCVEVINVLPTPLKASDWGVLVNGMLANVREIEAPPDSGTRGLFMYYLESFCTTRAPANKKDEILLGKPFHDMGRTYFRVADFMRYLEQQRFRDVRGNRIYSTMRDEIKDVQHHFTMLRGKGTNYWSVPSFDMQTEAHDVPKIPEEEF